MNSEHTPTPWRELPDGHIGVYGTGAKANFVIAEICSGNIADKGFILSAANSNKAFLDLANYVLSDDLKLEVNQEWVKFLAQKAISAAGQS